MKILLANKFFYPKGGAETAFLQTGRLMEKMGHKVIYFSMKHPMNLETPYKKYFVSNVDYERGGLAYKVKAALKLLYSFEAGRKMEELIQDERPDIAHLFNIYHQLSPSILYSLKRHSVPIVMTLNDYKMACASYLLLYKGKICKSCRGGNYYECLLKNCVKESRLKSLLNTFEMYLHHKVFHWYDVVDMFISPSRFLQSKLHEMGFSQDNIIHLSHFSNIEDIKPSFGHEDDSVIYVGRLSKEKGLDTLINAVKGSDRIHLKIVGDGPMREEIEERIRKEGIRNIRLLGHKIGSELEQEIRKSRAVVLPSLCYEVYGLSITEGYVLGKPAVGANIGGIPEVIQDNVTGLLFNPGDEIDLRKKIEFFIENPDKAVEMGKNGRRFAEVELNPKIYYERLMQIYQMAFERHKINKR